ncbi:MULTISPECIES: sulfite exporter TauE/SafE family protein [unclassified Photobacterium]|uniref:sulfite exporter TauE/SafE family protein n=1 Tax=unclassified Photobacterium TaxID=2628852 RepID=UPI000D1555AD|nr:MULTISPECIES: sulfite exporter TauE/SafE family protein [unclassified Photobacterium]PSV27563.1 permease [Photobacterium sp. GB-56]PSV28582.1 permease [Photobacterium sp. GB-72]PSV34596.1 permease [Photobacterium sp. GB-210]PSV37235.1 permease [Photobacterium sp. GB-27]PSV44570.1 permease [Photobacterium sp. GB-36]
MTIEPTTLLAIAAIFVGSYVQTAIGFGLAIVSAPILIVYAPQYVPAPICLIALFISLLNALKHRSSIELGGLKMAILGRVPGSIAGAALLVYVSAHVLTLWIGLLVLLAVVVSILPYRIEPTPRRMVIAGFFSGLFGTSSAIGGPPMAILLQHQEANQLRGNLSAFFVFSSIVSLAAQIPVGFLSFDKLWITLPLIPSAWLGYWLALKTTQSLPKEKIRYAALILCLICGIIAIYESIH